MSSRDVDLPPVVVTRAEDANGPLSTQLRERGLKVLLWPATRTADADSNALDEALRRIGNCDWIVFASRHAVAAVLERLRERPANLCVAAVGRATAQVLKQRGWAVNVVPDRAEAGALVSALAPELRAGMRVLYPASSRALPTIAKGLAQLGVEVEQVEAYRTEPAPLDAAACRATIERGGVGVVTFSSPSAVLELERALGTEAFKRLLAGAPAVAIGPTTARALAQTGHTAVMAESATLAGLANTALQLLTTSRRPRESGDPVEDLFGLGPRLRGDDD